MTVEGWQGRAAAGQLRCAVPLVMRMEKKDAAKTIPSQGQIEGQYLLSACDSADCCWTRSLQFAVLQADVTSMEGTHCLHRKQSRMQCASADACRDCLSS